MTIAAQQYFQSDTDIFGNLSQENGRNVTTLVEWHRRRPAIRMSKLFVGTALSNFSETEILKSRTTS
jgi:hypothetical protein